uniref:Uncharacterized protein n=1 Tax=Oryza brachyantha TaxID=4533 RepID=J3M6K8_ORYBR
MLFRTHDAAAAGLAARLDSTSFGAPTTTLIPVPPTDCSAAWSGAYSRIDVMPFDRYIPTTELAGGRLLALMP